MCPVPLQSAPSQPSAPHFVEFSPLHYVLRAVYVLILSTGVCAIKILNPRCQLKPPDLWDPSGISPKAQHLGGVSFPLPGVPLAHCLLAVGPAREPYEAPLHPL